MVHYRLYFQNAAGRFMRAEDVEVDDDAAAREVARELDHVYGIEIWTGTRIVGIVGPGAYAARPAVAASA
jgi:hypothetical protein